MNLLALVRPLILGWHSSRLFLVSDDPVQLHLTGPLGGSMVTVCQSNTEVETLASAELCKSAL